MSDFDDFVEVTNELPYKKIKSINIISVKLETDQFKIKCRCQIQGTINDTQTLVRSSQDIAWLIDNIVSNKKTYLSPKINTQTYLQLFYSKISTHASAKVQSQKMLSQKMVERAFKIITTIILEHVKRLGDQYVYPIFIFFHKNFGLYKNPIYYKEQTTPLTQKMGNYLWEKYAKLSNKTARWEQLQKCKEAINNQMLQFEQVRAKLADYTQSLAKLQEQFIGQKQKIKNQFNLIEKLLFSYEKHVKYLQLVVEQITQTLIKIQDRSAVENLMKQYVSFLTKELQKSKEAGKELIREYVLVMCQHQEKIKIAPR